ncbi:MAG: prolyl aminopeptidase [Parcubacteria group bacterium RIFOXYD2_FULL_52_8]|nr:MAG: prolyl aminopeptidase [Parcubacteria group bacterium RIFOXYD2_FULL_52_8]
MEDNYVHDKGHLKTDDGHEVFWEDWGSRTATPIFFMHGGPGGGCGENSKNFFDPAIHRVIFHDQRGSGRSLPFAETENNTSQHLIADIEAIRTHLGIEKIHIMGGSWGSTLTLLYALAHPERVKRILVWSLYLIRQFETDFVNEGYPRFFFPEAWERFISLVPEEHRTKGDDVMQYYAKMMRSEDEATARTYADEWTLWEITLCSILYDPLRLEKETLGDKDSVAIARLETHYFLNKCFVPENYILDNIRKIRHLPCNLVQGRFDFCTPPISAVDLKRAYGDNLDLRIVNAGHLSSDPELGVALTTILRDLFT